MTGRFQPGSHLHVRRALGYFHHGIYVSDERVIQFGSGARLWDKAGTAVNAVTLAEFENGGTASVVPAGYDSLLDTGYHPAPEAAWKVIARAEYMLKLQHRLPYNLIGHNCEIIANLCAAGGWSESYQVRRFFRGKALISAACLMYISWLGRKNLPLPSWVAPAAITSVLVSVITIGTYNDQIRRLWREIRTDWQEHERMLAEDPRNEQPGR